MPKAKKSIVSPCKDFAPSGHHISNIDEKARNSIKVISSLECFPQPCQSFLSIACKCMCISDMIEQHHLQLDDIKFFCALSKEMWDDEDVATEGCSAIVEFLHLFSSKMSMKSLMFMFLVNIRNVTYEVTLCWRSLRMMFGLS